MQVLLLLSRPLVIMLWCKMWDMDFGAADAANPYGQMEDAMPTPPPRRLPQVASATRAAATGIHPTPWLMGTPRSGRAAAPTCPPPWRSNEPSRRRKIRAPRVDVASNRHATHEAKTKRTHRGTRFFTRVPYVPLNTKIDETSFDVRSVRHRLVFVAQVYYGC